MLKPLAFKVTNFRSIVDSGWVKFSPDGVTVFVGQNESGKTSILDALHLSLSNSAIADDDCRIGADLPEVEVSVEVNLAELKPELVNYSPSDQKALYQYLKTIKNEIKLKIFWNKTLKDNKNIYELNTIIDSQQLIDCLALKNPAVTSSDDEQAIGSKADVPNQPEALISQGKTDYEKLTPEGVASEIYYLLPQAVLFNSESGYLPNQVDINEKGKPIGSGALAATNFLQVADIKLESLINGDKRTRKSILDKANKKISLDFNSFWSQTIGKSIKLRLNCDLDYYDQSAGEKSGKPHLVFWASDGNTHLYPKQRSTGVKWFISFYLQLKASEKTGNHRIYLLDEPGSNLHSKAQADVLKLINKLSKETLVVYSTHSPHMLEYPKLFRVHAVQRDGEQDDSPTIIISAHELGTASSDTLSPVLTAMGADLSNQSVIKKHNNILLEEMSGYYYLTSFWKLVSCKQSAHFIAATGVNKIEALANMFVGWGLNFIVVIDDDTQGRGVFKSLKHNLFGDDEAMANNKILKLPECPGIEDVFSTKDFKKFVIKNTLAVIKGRNTEYLRHASKSKPVLAYQFALDIENGKVAWSSFDSETQGRINVIVDAIKSRLDPNINELQ